MLNFSVFKIPVLALLSILVFTVSSANADENDENNLITVSGVVLPNPLRIAFPPDPMFIVSNPATGIFIITIETQLRCIFNGDQQAAIGVRLATPANDSPGGNYTISPILFVDTDDVEDICNDTARYQFTVRKRSDDSLVDRAFSFQITGSEIDDDDDDDDD